MASVKAETAVQSRLRQRGSLADRLFASVKDYEHLRNMPVLEASIWRNRTWRMYKHRERMPIRVDIE